MRLCRLCLFIVCAAACAVRLPGARAEPEFDPEAATYDELIFHVQRYGNTEQKRENKKAAWEEIFGRGPDALREVMERIHIDNVMIGVLAQNMVQQFDPTNTGPVLVEFVSSTNARTRKIAVYFLGFHEEPAYVERVMPLLDDEDAAGATMRTLGKWGARSAVSNILPFLEHEREVRRVAAVNALRDIGDPVAVPGLIDALSDPAFTVREAAQRALTELGRPARDAMLRALPEAGDPARRHMIRALGRFDSWRVRRVLRRYTGDADSYAARDARRALGEHDSGGVQGR